MLKMRLLRQRPFTDIVTLRVGGGKWEPRTELPSGERAQGEVLPGKKGSWTPEMAGKVGVDASKSHHCQVKK